MKTPPVWTEEQLTADLSKSVELFRKERLEEDVSEYGVYFDQFLGHFETLIEKTVDLTQLEQNALDILTDANLFTSFRYLAGPPISEDDLETIAEATLSPTKLKADPKMVDRVVQVIMAGLDRRRFPWVVEKREPEEAERQAAVLASAALIASQKIATQRRTEASTTQQDEVMKALTGIGMTKIAARDMTVIREAPKPGEFCGEAMLSGRKADITIGLYDHRVMPIECKVSNSKLNSIKRLTNDTAVKAETWRKDLGEVNVIPVAVLGGVYGVPHLLAAQKRGLTLFWAHSLQPLLDFIQSTKPA